MTISQPTTQTTIAQESIENDELFNTYKSTKDGKQRARGVQDIIDFIDAASGSSKLANTGTLPSVTGFNAGDLISLNGVIYTLVGDAQNPNFYHGVIAADAGGDTGYFGDTTFRFQPTDPFNMRGFFPKSELGATAPASLWVKYHSGSDYADIKLDYAMASNTPTHYAYHHSPGTPGLEAPYGWCGI